MVISQLLCGAGPPSIARPAFAGRPWVGQFEQLGCGYGRWSLTELTTVKVDSYSRQEHVIG